MAVNKPGWLSPKTFLLSYPAGFSWGRMAERPPIEHAHRLSARRSVWERQLRVIYLAASGFSLAREIQVIMGDCLGIRDTAGSLKRLMTSLTVGSGLLYTTTLTLKAGYGIPLSVVRLTRRGIGLARRLGWAVYQNEWERLQCLHEKGKHNESAHTCAVLAFAYQARLRGYRAGVMPHVDGGRFAPDSLVVDGDDEVFVEVELENDKPAKWQNMAEGQGLIALCGKSARHRATLVNECTRFGVPILATDLQTLFRDSGMGVSGSLWVEER